MSSPLDKLDRLLTRLSTARPRTLRPHHACALLAALLTAPALVGGLVLDDHVLVLGATQRTEGTGLHASPLSLFRFTTGRADDNHALMDHGALLPWWSDPHHLNAFFRPLSSLSHVLDIRVLGAVPWVMHLHSILWLIALVLAVAHVYARIDPAPDPLQTGAYLTRATALAIALFAIDEAHGMTVGWIANRNALIATTLALPALGAHHRYVTQGFALGRGLGRGLGRVLGPLCFALGLLGGETAVAVLGYVLAHAIALDRAPIARRVLHLLPYLAVLIAWRLVFAQLGLGSAGSGAYHDPLGEPLGYARALAVHLPLLLGSQLGLPVADAWFWGEPALQHGLLAVAVFTVLGVLGLAHVLLRRDPVARFWMIGMVLSSCAVAASVPGERLLLVPSIGGAVLLAKLLIALLDALRASTWSLPFARPLATAAFVALAFTHGPAALVGLPLRAGSMHVLGSAIERADAGIPRGREITDQDVVIVNAPFDVLVSYLQVARAAHGVPRPRHLNWLATASSELEITRVADRVLRVRPAEGFVRSAPERHYRGDPSALRIGERIELSALTIEVVEVTEDGRPAAIDAHFKAPLPRAANTQAGAAHARPLRLLREQSGALVPFVPPPLGERVVLPKASFLATLARQALRMLTGRAHVLEGDPLASARPPAQPLPP